MDSRKSYDSLFHICMHFFNFIVFSIIVSDSKHLARSKSSFFVIEFHRPLHVAFIIVNDINYAFI